MSDESENRPFRGDIHGHIADAGPPQLDPGHTNNNKGLGQRHSNASNQRHFSRNLSSSKISEDFWTNFIEQTKARYEKAPDLNLVELKHPMHPNTHLPGSIADEEGNITWDDLNAVSPGDSYENSVVLPPCINWPLQGPTARRRGPAGEQNPKYASSNTTRPNYIFMEARKTRYSEG